MIKYTKSFKTLLAHYHQTNSKVMSSADFKIPRQEIDYLAAKGLINIVPYVNGDLNCRITISDKGLIYFDELRDKRLRFFLPFTVSLIALIISVLALFVSLEQLSLQKLQFLK